jgi:hypothetical protein
MPIPDRLDDLAIVCYTHSNCADMWPMYLGQMNKYLPEFKDRHWVITNGSIPADDNERQKLLSSDEAIRKLLSGLRGVDVAFYDDSTPYWTHWIEGLKHVNTEFFLYMQEDYLLYDDVDLGLLSRYLVLLRQPHVFGAGKRASFVRLIRSGIGTANPDCLPDTIHRFPRDAAYPFSMQATIWRKEDFIRLYETARVEDHRDETAFFPAMRQLNLRGLYHYAGEPKRGRDHYDSSVFPYISTAVVSGKWNLAEYPEELGRLLDEYRIDPSVRGMVPPVDKQTEIG